MSEKKITFVKGRPESTSNRQSNDFKEEKIRKEKEKYSIEKRVSKVMSEKGVSLAEAINIVQSAPQRSERPFDPRKPRFNGERKPYAGTKKPFDGGERRPYNPDRKPREDSEKREHKPREGGFDKKPYDGERKSGGYNADRKPREGSEKSEYKPREYNKSRSEGEKREYKPREGEERKPYAGTKKPFDGERRSYNPDRKPREGGFDKKPYDGERKSGGYNNKPKRDMKFGERRNSGGDNSLLLALQKKIEILKNAGKLNDGSESN